MLFFLERVLKVDPVLTNQLIAVALLLGTPMFVLFGWLSDKIGRKPIIMAGCLLAALTLFPLFKALTVAANPALAAAAERAPITVPRRAGRLFLPVRSGGPGPVPLLLRYRQSWLARAGLPTRTSRRAPGAVSEVSHRRQHIGVL